MVKQPPWPLGFIHVLIPVVIVFGIVLCFCTCALTCMQALIYRWISSVVGGEKTLYVKIPTETIHDNEQEENSMMEWAPGIP